MHLMSAVAFLALAIPCVSHAQAQTDKAVKSMPFPDGVIDPSLQTAYVTSPKGGIQAIRLKDGAVLWTNDTCQAQPWLTAGDRLVARGDGLFILNTKDGKQQPSEPIAYPRLAVPDRCTVSFPLWGPRVVGDTLEAHWFAVANIDRGKGRPFNFQGWTAFNKAAPAGIVTLDLTTGKSTLRTDPKSVDVTSGLVPEASKREQRIPAGLSADLQAVWRKYFKDEDGRIAVSGDRLVGVAMILEKVGNEYNKKIVVSAWDLKTGKAAEPVTLVKDKALNIANVVITEDHRHAIVVFSNITESIYSLADGKLVAGNIKGIQSPDRAFVHGGRLYHTQTSRGGPGQASNVLRAVDLATGNVAWEQPLKPQNTRPLPP